MDEKENLNKVMDSFKGNVDKEKLKEEAKDMEKEILQNADLGIFPYLPYLFIAFIIAISLHSFFITIPKVWFIIFSILLAISSAVLSYMALGMYSVVVLQKEAGQGLMNAFMNNQEKKEKDPNYFG